MTDRPPANRAHERRLVLERRKQALEDQLTAALIRGTDAEIRQLEARLAAVECDIAR